MSEIDDYEKRITDDDYMSDATDYMYEMLHDRWTSESIPEISFDFDTYNDKQFLLNVYSQSVWEWKHYMALPKYSKAKIETLTGDYIKFRPPVVNWVQNVYEKKNNLIFYGSNGSGKTHAAMAAARFLALHGTLNDDVLYMPSCRFMDCMDVHNSLDNWKKDDTVQSNLDSFKAAELLLVDDFGAIPTSAKSAVSNVVSIISHRYNHSMPTIFTSNPNVKELSELYGSTIIRRVVEGAVVSK